MSRGCLECPTTQRIYTWKLIREVFVAKPHHLPPQAIPKKNKSSPTDFIRMNPVTELGPPRQEQFGVQRLGFICQSRRIMKSRITRNQENQEYRDTWKATPLTDAATVLSSRTDGVRRLGITLRNLENLPFDWRGNCLVDTPVWAFRCATVGVGFLIGIHWNKTIRSA